MRRLIVRGPKSRRIADKIAHAKLVALSLEDNAYFPDQIPAHADLEVHLAAAEAAQVATLTRTAGTAAALTAALRAVDGDRISGAVILVARAIARKASYEWQYSTDEKSWVSAETTFECKTELFGLARGPLHYLRFRARTRGSLGNWSQVVSFIVA